MSKKLIALMIVLAFSFAALQPVYAAKMVGNRVCPVSGENIPEGKEVQYEYNGKVYNFCCKMCLKDFNKDPEKYVKKIEEMQEMEHKASHYGHDH